MSDKKIPGSRGKNSSGRRTTRDKSVRVKSARGRKNSSTRWLQRQLNDPFVREAQRLGYRGRAAFKLKGLDERLNLIKPGMRIVDLGAAPGSWSQVIMEKKPAQLVALDILEMEPMPGVDVIQMDFTDNDAPDRLKEVLNGKADLVLSDIAPNTTGHAPTDHLRMMALVEMAYEFATEVLSPGGAFVAKVFQGGAENTLMARMKKDFTKTRHIKPPASRSDSSEQFVVAQGFKGS